MRRISASLALTVMLAMSAAAIGQVRRTLRLTPGTRAEAAACAGKEFGSIVEGSRRTAAPGAGWAYRLPVLPGATCRLVCHATGSLTVSVSDASGKPVPWRREELPDGFAITTAVGTDSGLGSLISFSFRAAGGGGALQEAEYTVTVPDANRNGIPDCLDLAVKPAPPPVRVPRPAQPMTCFQTPQAYQPDFAVPTDAVLLYASSREAIESWASAGYAVYVMGGFREYEDYAREHPDEVQTDRDGRPLVIGGSSYYMVPTAERSRRSARYYLEALANGARGVCPEEPEIFARAGYSEAFKKEWQAAYGSPWVPPHTSVASRYLAEQLKAALTVRQIRTILGEVQRQAPSAARLLAVHSPVTYSDWGIVVPHAALFRLPEVQEVVAQVWTGTARTPNRVAGVRAERTFSLAYLEYASFHGLTRGTGKPVWLLLDPVEDNPDRSMDDYRRNYSETLLAALMCPWASRFEVLPWPSRIYGRVPPDYATIINTVTGVLADWWRYPGQVTAGTSGVGLLIADSMALQRGDPSPSDFDGVYGMSLPLITRGVPADVLSLDRCTEPGYLNGTRVLLASYDHMKPGSAALHGALADWVRSGGVLLLFGGSDAYDDVPDSWWRRSGDASPLDDLFRRLGLQTRRVSSGGVKPVPRCTAQELLRGDGAERNLRNRRRYALDISSFARPAGSVCLRFEDVSPEDGWGPYVTTVELRVNDRLAASFRAGSEIESRFLWQDRGSMVSGGARYADGPSYWEYRFDNLPRDASVILTVDMGNGFRVSAYSPDDQPEALEAADDVAHPTVRRLRLVPGYQCTVYEPPAEGRTLYRRTSDGRAAVWQAKVGAGTVIFCGLPPGYLTATTQTDRWLRDLVRRGCLEAGLTLETAPAFLSRRGPYVAVRALSEPQKLSGRYVDLLSADLRVLRDPEIAPGYGTLLKDISSVSSGRILAVSGRLDALSEGTSATVFAVRAPEGTEGAARLSLAAGYAKSVKAWDAWGREVPVSARQEADTVLLRYSNRADGVVVRVVWK